MESSTSEIGKPPYTGRKYIILIAFIHTHSVCIMYGTHVEMQVHTCTHLCVLFLACPIFRAGSQETVVWVEGSAVDWSRVAHQHSHIITSTASEAQHVCIITTLQTNTQYSAMMQYICTYVMGRTVRIYVQSHTLATKSAH